MARKPSQPSQAYLKLRADKQAWRDVQAATRRLQLAQKAGLASLPQYQHLRVTLAATGYKFTRSKNITTHQANVMVKAARELLYNQSDPTKGKRKDTKIASLEQERNRQLEVITQALGVSNITYDEAIAAWRRIYGTSVRELIKSYGYEAVNEQVIAATANNQNVTYTLVRDALNKVVGQPVTARREENQPDYPEWMKDKQITQAERDYIVQQNKIYTQADNPQAKKELKEWNELIRDKFKNKRRGKK